MLSASAYKNKHGASSVLDSPQVIKYESIASKSLLWNFVNIVLEPVDV